MLALPLLQIQTVFVGGSNERRSLADTINIAQVFNKDVFAYKRPLPFLCLQIFALVITTVILLWLNCLTCKKMLKVDIQRVNARAKPFFVPVFKNFFHKDKTTIQSCNVVWKGLGWCHLGGVIHYSLSGASKRSASPCQFCSSGSCSSRSWCVSQEAGGVRLWR